MVSSQHPRRVLIASKVLMPSSHCILSRSYGVLACNSLRSRDVFTLLARRFHFSCATLLVYAVRFHGLCIAFSRRSGTALTACRQMDTKSLSFSGLLSSNCTDPLFLALATVCENGFDENV